MVVLLLCLYDINLSECPNVRMSVCPNCICPFFLFSPLSSSYFLSFFKKEPSESLRKPRGNVVFSLAVPSPRIFRLLTKTKSLYDSTVTVDVTVVEVVEESTTLCYELCQ